MLKRIGSPAGLAIMRMAHLHAFSGYLRDIGVPVESAYRRARLPVLCDDPDAYVPVRNVWAFFEDISQREGAALGWEVGRRVQDTPLHPGLLAHLATQPTLHKGIEDCVALAGTESSQVRMGITQQGGEALIWVVNSFSASTPGYHISQAYALMLILAVIRHYAGRSWLPPQIGIEAPAVPKGAQELLPGVHLRPGQRMGYLRIPQTLLSLPPDPDWANNKELFHGISTLTRADRLGLTGTLRQVLETYLPDGCLTVEQAAELVGVSSRTLRRSIEREGLSYSELVDQVRLDTATRLLGDPEVKIIEIAYELGYSDPSHFTRSFRRLTGVTPSAYRRDLLAPHPPVLCPS